jgi:hypothetical protein
VLVDADGDPLGTVIAAANVNDHLLLRQTIEACAVLMDPPRFGPHYGAPNGRGEMAQLDDATRC